MSLRILIRGEGIPSPLAPPLLVASYDTQGYVGPILNDGTDPKPTGPYVKDIYLIPRSGVGWF